jgi:hypothetical protein
MSGLTFQATFPNLIWSNKASDGLIGYTCMGITPNETWRFRENIFAWCRASFSGAPSEFTKYCFDRDKRSFRQSAMQVRCAVVLLNKWLEVINVCRFTVRTISTCAPIWQCQRSMCAPTYRWTVDQHEWRCSWQKWHQVAIRFATPNQSWWHFLNSTDIESCHLR